MHEVKPILHQKKKLRPWGMSIIVSHAENLMKRIMKASCYEECESFMLWEVWKLHVVRSMKASCYENYELRIDQFILRIEGCKTLQLPSDDFSHHLEVGIYCIDCEYCHKAITNTGTLAAIFLSFVLNFHYEISLADNLKISVLQS